MKLTWTKYQNHFVVFSCLFLFTIVFCFVTSHALPGIFKKDLYQHDESSNAVVAANLTRKFFPAMVRTNPLYEEQGIWMEGPQWQHIPPLFEYIPLPMFWMDGHVSIEVRRMAYALILLLAGYIFILGVYRYDKKYLGLFAATFASIFFISSSFSQSLVTGLTFGTSDIALAFTAVCSFVALLWYLKYDRELRIGYSYKKLMVIAAIVALPILAKNVLGAIPAAIYIVLLLWDNRRITKKILAASGVFLGVLAIYYGLLYLSSPEAFKAEILLPLAHTQPNFEGWGRPWYYFFTAYLPQQYFLKWYIPFALATLVGLIILIRRKFDRRTSSILWLSFGWFAWNLIAVSLVSAKVPNFAYQSFLFGILFSIYALLAALPKAPSVSFGLFRKANALGFLVLMFLTIYSGAHLITRFKETRASAYSYSSEHEKFYHFGEVAQSQGITNKDLFIFNATPNDCWFRYYTLFLTGAESRTFDEVYNIADVNQIKQKYQNVYFVIPKIVATPSVSSAYLKQDIADYSVFKFKTQSITPTFISDLKTGILDPLHVQINGANRNCEWLMQSEDLFHKYH